MSESREITVHCQRCNSPVGISIPAEDIASAKDGILRVMMVHGDPMHAIVVYVDKHLRVREIEYSDSFQMDEPQKTTVVSADQVAENLSESLGEPCFQALYEYDQVKDREQTSFVLDKKVLRTICDSGTICLSAIRQQVASLEKALGSKIDLPQIEAICERYLRDGLIRKA